MENLFDGRRPVSPWFIDDDLEAVGIREGDESACDGLGRAIYTFGGDRETFDFFDPTQWLNVDKGVWRFSLEKRQRSTR